MSEHSQSYEALLNDKEDEIEALQRRIDTQAGTIAELLAEVTDLRGQAKPAPRSRYHDMHYDEIIRDLDRRVAYLEKSR